MSIVSCNVSLAEKLGETTLFEVYTETFCLCARTIYFFRSNPHNLLRRNACNECQGDFSRTIKRIKRLSAAVETEADLARMRSEKDKYLEVLEVVKDLKRTNLAQEESSRHWYVPRSQTKYFSGREEEVESLRFSLLRDKEEYDCKISAVHGMGGVGKTQVALNYATLRGKGGDNVFWMAADNPITIKQSCRNVCEQLKILEQEENDADGHDDVQAFFKFKSWLAESRRPWLLILDNVSVTTTAKQMIPNTGVGSVLVTTRDFNIARELAHSTFQLQPFNTEEGARLLLRVVGFNSTEAAVSQSAREISQALGGLPLALTQIGRFIAQRKLPIAKFLPLYERNQSRVDAHQTTHDDYEHTLSTVWQLSLDGLEGNAELLQKILAFFEPDSISEKVLAQGSRFTEINTFEFLSDELDLLDAEQALMQLALIDKNADNASLSLHRLVQATVLRRIDDEERAELFRAVSRMLSWGFPDHWTKDQGHQVSTWDKCEMCLPHIYHLIGLSKQYNIPIQDAQGYAELLLRCSWYLYERELYTLARTLVNSALPTFPDKTHTAYANALDLSGLISIDLVDFSAALSAFTRVLSLREASLPETDPFIAFSLNNVALVQTELGHLDAAMQAHARAIEIRKTSAPDRLGNSYSNLSSLQLRMAHADEAEKTLAMCPSLKAGLPTNQFRPNRGSDSVGPVDSSP